MLAEGSRWSDSGKPRTTRLLLNSLLLHHIDLTLELFHYWDLGRLLSNR